MRRAGAAVLAAAICAVASLQSASARAADVPLRYERDVTPGGKGPNRLAIDVPLLAGAAPLARGTRDGLQDLRFFSADGKEVPYLLIGPPRGEPVWLRARVLPILATKTESGFEADLGSATVVDRLDVTGIPAPYLKRVRLEGSGDRSRWTLLAAEGTLFDLPDEGLSRTWLGFPPSELRYLRATWDDTKSGRVPPPGSVRARTAGTDRPPPALRAVVPFERRAGEPGRSRYVLKLPAGALPVESIEVLPDAENVLRTATVSELRLAGSELKPYALGTARLRRAVRDGVAADALAIPISVPSKSEVELVIEDDDNPPLVLREVAAIFAPLPWIFFESPGVAPLTARFGAPQGALVVAPRYDLEAERDAVERGRIAPIDARWGERRLTAGADVASAPVGSPVPAGAPIDSAGFRFSRSVPDGPAGLSTLLLDAHVLAHAPGLASVRIADAGKRQVPYLVETRGAPLRLALPAPEPAKLAAETRGAPPRSTLYRLKLPFARLPDARLVVGTSARVFTRNAVVLIASDDVNERDGPALVTVAQTTWAHADPETPAPHLTLALAPLSTTDLILAIDDGDNSPLPLASPVLELPAIRLRFFRDGKDPLTLLYGKDDLAAPRYDLAILAPRLLGGAARELVLGPDLPAAPAQERQLAKTLFWSALVVAVVLLLGIVVKLLGKGETPAN